VDEVVDEFLTVVMLGEPHKGHHYPR